MSIIRFVIIYYHCIETYILVKYLLGQVFFRSNDEEKYIITYYTKVDQRPIGIFIYPTHWLNAFFMDMLVHIL